jgi:hypothetical protein
MLIELILRRKKASRRIHVNTESSSIDRKTNFMILMKSDKKLKVKQRR